MPALRRFAFETDVYAVDRKNRPSRDENGERRVSMLELVIFDADGVLFDSTESNTAYYNAIFARVGEPPMSPVEEKAGVFMSAPQVFQLRSAGDPERIALMREAARTMDATPFFHLLRPFPGL